MGRRRLEGDDVRTWRRAPGTARAWAAAFAALVVCAVLVVGTVLATCAGADPRWTERERNDLLEPWSMEPGAGAPLTLPARPQPPVSDAPEAGGDPTSGAPRPGVVPAGEGIEVVRCRQLVISQPARAERLVALLRGGADLETAKRSLGGVHVAERTRDYPLADLEADIRAEIAAMNAGDWSRVRQTGGRALVFQLVAREHRDPASLPAFGTGLGPDELARVQRLQRPRPAPRPVRDETADAEGAAIVQQVDPEYPAGATESGSVTVRVQIGRADDVVDVQVESATHDIFKEPALRAARHSTYRTARRDGIPELSSVTVTFNFVAPPALTPGEDPPQPR
jgi:hypothetical protein